MEFNAAELLENLENQFEENRKEVKEIENMIQEQENTLRDALEKYEPIYKWYKEKNLYFTHPNWKVRSVNGPVLGFIEKEQEVIVYNIERESIQKIYIHDNEEKKTYPIYRLIRDGRFADAMEGLLFLERMLEFYNEKNNERIERLKSELESVKLK